MNYGSHQTVNNIVCYYQTPLNISLILEQVSNYNNMLREQVNMEKSEHGIQNNMISENNIIRPRMRAIVKEHAPNVLDDDNLKNESKDMKEDKWFKPKKCMPINYFYKICENKPDLEKSNNKHIELVEMMKLKSNNET